MAPVAIPGTADGRVCRHTVCNWVAPRASEPSRISDGTARRASRVAMMITGRISRLRAMAPAITMFLFCTPTRSAAQRDSP